MKGGCDVGAEGDVECDAVDGLRFMYGMLHSFGMCQITLRRIRVPHMHEAL
jgi:hypothetical protein